MTTRVLCVDDDDLIRDALVLLFGQLGLEARCCSNGQQCLEEFERSWQSYDLVLVNYEMPGMSGVDVVRKLQSIAPRKKICLTSGHSSERVLSGFGKSELGEFLPKPYSLGKLRRFLRRNLAVTIARVHVLTERAGDKDESNPWLKSLRDAAQAGQIELRLHSNVEGAISRALEGFPNVIVWDVETIQPHLSRLERLGLEGVPVVFAGPLPEGHGLERFGLILERRASGREIAEVVRQAALGAEG